VTAVAGRSSLRRPLLLGAVVALAIGAVFVVTLFTDHHSLDVSSDTGILGRVGRARDGQPALGVLTWIGGDARVEREPLRE
jgi:hypothetical protein